MLDHSSSSGKRFLKWPPEVIPKNLYVNIFCTSWPMWMIKMCSVRFFRVLNLLQGVLKWSEIRIMRNPNWPPFCFIKFYFYSHNLLLTQVVLMHPHYSTILIRGLLWMILMMLPEKKWGAIWVSAIFQYCRNENLIWTISPVIIYIESYFWCLHLCFHGQRIEWNHL